MKTARSDGNRGGDGLVAALLLLGAAALAVGWGYGRFRGEVNGLLIGLHRLMLLPFLWDPDSARLWRLLGDHPPAEFTWAHVSAQMEFVGRWWRWVVPWPLLAAAALLFRKGAGLSRRFQMKSLLRHNVRVFPALAPVAWRELDREPLDRGPWRAALTPVEIACDHGLLVGADGLPLPRERFLVTAAEDPKKAGMVRDNSADPPALRRGVALDRARAAELFARQLGRPFRGVESLADHEAGLAAAFILLGLGERDRGFALLDSMSLSFREAPPEGTGRAGRMRGELHASMARGMGLAAALENAWRAREARSGPHVAVDLLYRRDGGRVEPLRARGIVAQRLAHPAVAPLMERHGAWTNPLLCALLRFARRRTVVAAAEFIWLRPTDRSLWYSLHQVSEAVASGSAGVDRGLGAWAEAAGVWAHMGAEGALGRRLAEPCVEGAVEALARVCVAEGWMDAAPDRAVEEEAV